MSLDLNGVKTGFLNQCRKGFLKIVMKKVDNNYSLIVSDDGKGIAKDIDIENSDSLGLQLVTALNAQLHGELKVISDKGTTFEILFPTGD